MKKKRVKVYRLPTEDVTHIGVCIKKMSDREVGDIQYFHSTLLMSLEYWVPQHLYFTVDEPLKDDGIEWVLDLITKIVYQPKNRIKGDPDKCRKIITSTDPKLTTVSKKCLKDLRKQNKLDNPYSSLPNSECTVLPQVPKSFIKEYYEQGGIDEVDVEYITYSREGEGWHTFEIKVDANNNIIICPCTKKYNEKRIKEITEELRLLVKPKAMEPLDKWIKQNL